MKSLFWSLAFVFSLAFTFAAYYITNVTVRTAVDSRAPWVHGYLGQFVHDASETKKRAAPATPAPEIVDAAPTASTAAVPAAEPAPAAPAEPEVFSLDKLAQNRAAWPAKVTINKTTEFPAVVNGNVVGKVQVAAGTEVKLSTISQGKLGVEYQGGGAWLAVEDTDLIARTQKRRN